ncbi:hypothetical protein CHRYSEOSP005_19700 [Chryseobacterium sp. Alg-005]
MIVELRHQIVEIRQKIKMAFENFQKKNNGFIFVTQSLNHKILLTIKIYNHGK